MRLSQEPCLGVNVNSKSPARDGTSSRILSRIQEWLC